MNIEEKQACYDALMIEKRVVHGIKYMGVKSTGIFCRPNCPARRPKLENCEFFTSTQAATKAGFRPCKRCKPTALPEWFEDWNSIAF
jgi:AraC family transcriptional regulator of adaptative response/methylated-DNA-[protein]-cysteine methyltransferase